MAKHVFVTGGVVTSRGKGITASSPGQLLKARPTRPARPHPLVAGLVAAAIEARGSVKA